MQHDGTPLSNFVSGYSSWPEYLQSMAMDGTWGDHVVLLAAANYYQTPIRIISSLDREILVPSDHAGVNASPLVLGHIHEFHYVSLQPRQGVCGRVKREKENNDEVIMGNRQTEADGKKNIIDLTSGFKIKEGTPSDEVLEVLAHRISPDCWKPLGRRLKIEESRLTAYDRENPLCREKAYSMLLFWKERDGFSARYQVLYDALCHDLVGLGRLAKEVCCD